MCEAWVHLSISVPVSNHHNPFGRCFDYHEKYKTLYHENTPNTKYLTGHYVKAHTQFKGKKMTVSAVIEYIASHEGWRAEQRSKTTKEKSE